MKWIGITGSLGTGKSSLAKVLTQMGYPVLDADQMAHKALEPGQEAYFEVISEFGEEILGSSGQTSSAPIDRKKLANFVFGNSDKLRALEKIVHPQVKKLVQDEKDRLKEEGQKIAFYDVPLLFEKNLSSQFDGVLVVSVKPEIQMQRIRSRNGWTDEEITKRLGHQMPLNEKVQKATWVIENNGSIDELQQKASDWIKSLVW